MLDSPGEVLTTMAGSFGYAAPEVMLKQGHGKAVDMWSLGVITYTLLCGYSPFRSENLTDLVDECRNRRIVFHERYWKDVSKDAKEFILCLLQPDPKKRATSQQALKHVWLEGETASDHDLIPEMKKYLAKARLKRGIEIIKLANRIEALKMQQAEDGDDDLGEGVPNNPTEDAGQALAGAPGLPPKVLVTSEDPPRKSLSKIAKGAIFREVVLAKVREMKEQQEHDKVQKNLTEQVERRRSHSRGSSRG
jgi:calcium/calmodulin-dependent protein kinase I